jgi:hypothetical protein
MARTVLLREPGRHTSWDSKPVIIIIIILLLSCMGDWLILLPVHADDVDAKTYYDHMRTLSTMGTFFCLADMLSELTKLSKWFQKPNVNFREIPAIINNMKSKFIQMYGIDMSYGEAASLLHFDPKSFLETRCTKGFFPNNFGQALLYPNFLSTMYHMRGGHCHST